MKGLFFNYTLRFRPPLAFEFFRLPAVIGDLQFGEIVCLFQLFLSRIAVPSPCESQAKYDLIT